MSSTTMMITILAFIATSISSANTIESNFEVYSSGPYRWWSLESENLYNDDKPRYDEHIRVKRSFGSYGTTKGSNIMQNHRTHGSSGGYQSVQNGANLGLYCVALARTATDTWCYDNCLQGHCPKSVCKCSGAVYDRNFKNNIYGGQSVSSGYVQPSLQLQHQIRYAGQSKYGQMGYGQPKYGQIGYGQVGYQKPMNKYGQQISQSQPDYKIEQQTMEY